MATVTVSGTPQSDTATSSGSVSNPLPVFGKYDRTNTITPETFSYNVAPENFGCIVRSEAVGCMVQPEQFGCVVDPCEPPPSGSGLIPIITASGSPQAQTATSSGSVSVIQSIEVSGTPQAETATSSGSVLVTGNVAASGTPQAETATSSGAATSIPALGAGNYIWLNPTTIVKSGTDVIDWDKDASSSYGGNANLNQLSNLIPESTVNGLDVCRSANTSPRYLLPSASVGITSGFTIYVVGGFDSIVNDPAFIVSGDGTDVIVFENAGGLLQIRGNSIGVLTSMTEDTNEHVWVARIDANNYRSRISGDPSGWVTSASATTQDLDYLAVLNDTNDLNTQVVGWAGEVIINTTADSDAKMDAWYAALLTKWGL